MSIKGILLQPVIEQCPYIDGMISISENFLAKELDDIDVESLLCFGFRHFGEIFFRPMCRHCLCCVSIRIPVQQFNPSKSVRRLFIRNKHFSVKLEYPSPCLETYALYNLHKKRFKRQVDESYEVYVKSFFYPFSFNRMLSIKDGDRYVGVSHLDVTANTMSAIYCYYDETYNKHSPGKFAIYKEIEIAKEMGIKWLYLGFYIRQNRHTTYKVDIHPNQLMLDNFQWIDYMDARGNIINPYPFPEPKFWLAKA